MALCWSSTPTATGATAHRPRGQPPWSQHPRGQHPRLSADTRPHWVPGWTSPTVQLTLLARPPHARSSGWVPHMLPTTAPIASASQHYQPGQARGCQSPGLPMGNTCLKDGGDHQALTPHIRAVPSCPCSPPRGEGALCSTAAPADGKGVCLQEGLPCPGFWEGGRASAAWLGRERPLSAPG